LEKLGDDIHEPDVVQAMEKNGETVAHCLPIVCVDCHPSQKPRGFEIDLACYLFARSSADSSQGITSVMVIVSTVWVSVNKI